MHQEITLAEDHEIKQQKEKYREEVIYFPSKQNAQACSYFTVISDLSCCASVTSGS